MTNKEEKLDQAALLVKDSIDAEVFTKFLDAFMEAEADHINANLNNQETFNLRTASLCAEAYSAAALMKKIILGEAEVNDLQ